MQNPKIVKVFFDCHKDSEALHKEIKCCIENVYDLQAMNMLIRQWKMGEKNDPSVTTPGLNKTLEECKASHGVNEYKKKMKEIFAEENGTYQARPLSLFFLKYAARDVEDLIELKDKMLGELGTLFKEEMAKKIALYLSKEYVKRGCEAFLKN
jgi:ribonuclease D